MVKIIIQVTETAKTNTTGFGATLQFWLCIVACSSSELSGYSLTSVSCDWGQDLVYSPRSVYNPRFQSVPESLAINVAYSPESLCGSESTKFNKTKDLKTQKFDFDEDVSMSNYGGYSHGDHYGRNLELRPRCELMILCKDNSNQGAWAESIDRWVRSNEAMKLMLKQFNEHRLLDIINDFAVDGPLKDALVKVETQTADTFAQSKASSAKESPGDATKEAERKDQEAKAADSAAREFVKIDQLSLEQTEKNFLSKQYIFFDPSKGDKIPEDKETTSLRFRFFEQLCRSCPHHVLAVKVVVPGDCFDFIKKVMRNGIVTCRTSYENMKSMCSIKWAGSVDGVVNRLTLGQQASERLGDATWTDSVMKGALLYICQDHPPFRELITHLSRSKARETFAEVHEELLIVEANVSSKPRYTAGARYTKGQSYGHVAGNSNKKKSWQEGAGAKGAGRTPPQRTEKERVSLEKYKAQCALEDCKGFLNGKCRFPPGKCWRRHPKHMAKKAQAAKQCAKGSVNRDWYDAVHGDNVANSNRANMLKDGDFMDDDEIAQFIGQTRLEYLQSLQDLAFG